MAATAPATANGQGKVADEELLAAEQLVKSTEELEKQAAALPPPPRDIAGSLEHKDKNYKLTVSNANGYLAHIMVDSTWDVPPEVLFQVFTYPDNSALFRDVKHVGERKVVSSKPGLRVVDVQQVGELRVLWVSRQYHTWLHVTEDTRDAESLTIQFDLLKSDVLAKFNGRWTITPIKNAAGAVTGCRGVLTQDVLPAGMPPYLQRIPVLGGLLRGVSAKSIRRIMEDLNAVMPKIAKGLASGKVIQHILNDLCGGPVKAEEGYANGAVRSFQVADMDEDDAESHASAPQGTASAPRALAVGLDVQPDETVRLRLDLQGSS